MLLEDDDARDKVGGFSPFFFVARLLDGDFGAVSLRGIMIDSVWLAGAASSASPFVSSFVLRFRLRTAVSTVPVDDVDDAAAALARFGGI